MDIDFNTDRLEKLGLTPRRARPQRRHCTCSPSGDTTPCLLHSWKRIVKYDDGCSCNALEPIACAYCRRKHEHDSFPW
jgi:hypothetical protein